MAAKILLIRSSGTRTVTTTADVVAATETAISTTTTTLANAKNNFTQAPTHTLAFTTSTPATRDHVHANYDSASFQSAAERLTPLLYDMLATATSTLTTALAGNMTNCTYGWKPNYNSNTNTNNNNTINIITDSHLQSIASGNATAGPYVNFNNQPHNISGSSTLEPHNSSAYAASDLTNTPPSVVGASVDDYLSGMAWPKIFIVTIFLLLILVTIIGNTLVILAVLTTRRLRTVTNCFVMNLAITDWLVGTCVMPPAVILYIVGSWHFGWILCDIWISLDVLLCTGSILSLCAISLDRYLAVTQPLTYSKKRRSKRLALFMIFVVWVTALSITCPPYLGWYEPGRRQEGNVVCRYNQNKGYVVFSAMGSFFIPLAVMLYVYLKIGFVLTSRRQRIVRDANSERTADPDIDCDNFLSESEHFHCITPKFPSFKTRWNSGNDHANNGPNNNSSNIDNLRCSKCNKLCTERNGLTPEPSFYELVEISRLSSLMHCSGLDCNFGSTMSTEAYSDQRSLSLPMEVLHYTDRRASFSETGLTATSTMSSATTQHAKFNPNHMLPLTLPLPLPLPPHLQHHSQHQHRHHHQHHHSQQHNQPTHLSQQHGQHQTQHQHHHHHHHRIPMRVSTTKRDNKTTKTLTMVMGGFIVCWLPFFVYYLLIPFLPRAAVIEGLMSFLTWVGWVNCAINPFIYAFYNPDFRIAFWRLTCRPICKQKPPPNHITMFRG